MSRLFSSVLLLSFYSIIAGIPHKQCQNISSQQNFNPSKYFRSDWYVTHTYMPSMITNAETMLCLKTKAFIYPNNIVRELVYAYVPWNNKTYYSENFINLNEIKNTGKYVGIAMTHNNTGFPILFDYIPVKETVVGTDYDNYSLLYLCLSNYDAGFLVLSRDQNAEEVHEEVEILLQELGLTKDKLLSVKIANCKADINF